jgi:hypothetical protein
MKSATSMRARDLRKLLNRNAVLLALNTLAGDGGIILGFSATHLAPLARRSVQVTRETLASLESDGLITRLDWRDGISSCILVMMDVEGAQEFVDENRAVYSHGRRRADREKGA